jgi:hypothetical protein
MNKLRLQVLNKTNGHCAYCGVFLDNIFQIDHIVAQRIFVSSIKNKTHIPLFLSHLTEIDLNHIDNLLPACRVCNKWKDTHHLELFRSEIEAQIERLNRSSSNFRFAKKYGLVKENPKSIIFYFENIKNEQTTPNNQNTTL